MAKFDAMAGVYDESRGGLARGRHFAQELMGWLVAGQPVLELGVGTGAVAKPLVEWGHQLVGIDISPAMLAKAADRVAGRVCLADAVALPCRDRSFGSAYATWVMNHLADPSAALAEAARVLRPGGRLLIMDRNLIDSPNDPWAVLHMEAGRRLGRKRPALQPRSRWFAQLAEPHGLWTIGIMPTAPWPEARTLRQAIDHARSRAFGWDGSDQQWSETMEPLLDELGKRPDADDIVVFEQGHEVLVLERQD